MAVESGGLTASKVLEQLRQCSFTHIVWLPDSESGFLYQAIVEDRSITLVPVCREGETIAIAMGLMLGGKEPVVIIQSTGFYEAGDSIRGLALDLKLPLVLLIGHRGFTRERPMTDSAAIYLEPILDAWGINHHLVESDADLWKIAEAQREAREKSKPVAILIGREYESP